jgi:hypothetical protein
MIYFTASKLGHGYILAMLYGYPDYQLFFANLIAITVIPSLFNYFNRI